VIVGNVQLLILKWPTDFGYQKGPFAGVNWSYEKLYTYDNNGNMITRNVGTAYSLTYDVENRLTGVSQGGTVIASFTYDGDGNRVKSVIGGTTTTFIGSHFEWSGSTSTMVKYYYAGGERVAMRSGATLYYLFSDHLGSTSVTATSSGSLHSRQLYTPWGEVRYTSGSLPTKYTFTGQFSYTGDFGLMFYNARWYDSYLNRWCQPDSIIPDPTYPQSFDRYAYVRNNPVNFVDPTGHREEIGPGNIALPGPISLQASPSTPSLPATPNTPLANTTPELSDALNPPPTIEYGIAQISDGCDGISLVAGGAAIIGGSFVMGVGGFLIATGAAHSTTIVGAALGVHEIAVGGIMVGLGFGGLALGGYILYQYGCIPYLSPNLGPNPE
jgi:RHS repeat-associated protein